MRTGTKYVPQPGNYSNSFNQFIYNEIFSDETCLDVGCWTGNLGEKLIKGKNCTVDGLDVNRQALLSAKRKGYRFTYLINLNDETVDLAKIHNKYHIIIFADILEHLINPDYILNAFVSKISPGGRIVISVPNVAFLLNRYELFLGRWKYREFGTLDKTHLRFFTINTIIELVEKSGYNILGVRPYNQFGILRHLAPLTRLFPTLFAYQTLIIAQPK